MAGHHAELQQHSCGALQGCCRSSDSLECFEAAGAGSHIPGSPCSWGSNPFICLQHSERAPTLLCCPQGRAGTKAEQRADTELGQLVGVAGNLQQAAQHCTHQITPLSLPPSASPNRKTLEGRKLPIPAGTAPSRHVLHSGLLAVPAELHTVQTTQPHGSAHPAQPLLPAPRGH